MRLAATSTVALLLVPTGSALAQKLAYDAGVAGDPATAPNPSSQGWTEILSGAATVVDVSPDADWGVNAWQVNDPGDGCATYFHETFQHMFDVGFELSAEIRLLAGGSTHLGVSTGTILTDSYWEASLGVQGQDVIVLDGPGNAIVCPGGADGAYHTYALRNPTGKYPSDLEFYYDGAHLGTIHELFGWWADKSGIAWGSGYHLTGACSPDSARARFHHVELRTLDYGPLGTSYCGPAVPNSSGQPGSIAAEGIAEAALNELHLLAVDLPPGQFGYFLASQTQGFVANPGGSQGNLCLGGTIARFAKQVQNTGPGGAMAIQVDLTAIPTSPPHSVMAGETWSFQGWFRDVNPTPTSNFTDGVSVTFG